MTLITTLRRTTEALNQTTKERDQLLANAATDAHIIELGQDTCARLGAERDQLRLVERGMQITIDELKADAERYDYLLTKRLGWISNRAPLPWGKQTQKEAMSLAIDAAMKGRS